MKHARADYNRIQDPAVNDPSLLAPGTNAIADDEPVFILRARDISAPAAVKQWAFIHQRNGGDRADATLAVEHARAMEEWADANGGAKVADLPYEKSESGE